MAAKKATKNGASARKAFARASARKDSAANTESAELIPRRWWWVLLGAGVLMIALGTVMAAAYSIPYAIDEPGSMELPFVDEYPTVVEILLPPFFAFFIGGILTFLGELLRRGTMLKNEATNVSVFRPLHVVVHAAWIVPPFVAWLIAMPWALSLLVQNADAGQDAMILGADSDAVFLVGVYGGLAALMTGAVAGSLFKKLWFLAVVRRSGAPESSSAFWWSFSFYWRLDVWLVALGVLMLGLAPLPLHFSSPGGTAATLGGGVALVALGLVTCTQYARAGMPLGLGTSVSGGYRSLLTPRRP